MWFPVQYNFLGNSCVNFWIFLFKLLCFQLISYLKPVVATKLSSMARYGDVSAYVAFDLDEYGRSRLGPLGGTHVRNNHSCLML